jgi:hypothetical protein
MYRAGRKLGLSRSVIDLARMVKEEIGEDVDEFEEEGLRRRLRESEGDGGAEDGAEGCWGRWYEVKRTVPRQGGVFILRDINVLNTTINNISLLRA